MTYNKIFISNELWIKDYRPLWAPNLKAQPFFLDYIFCYICYNKLSQRKRILGLIKMRIPDVFGVNIWVPAIGSSFRILRKKYVAITAEKYVFRN